MADQRFEMTHEEAKQIAARLICLGRAAMALDMPIQIASRWVSTSDLRGFADEAEKHIRALTAVLERYLADHPEELSNADEDTRLVVQTELDILRKHLGRIAGIVAGTLELNISEGYLPRDISPDKEGNSQ